MKALSPLAVLACAVLVGALTGVGPFAIPSTARDTTAAAIFTLCHTGGGTNCVVDGDTIWLAGEDLARG